ncbi:hypothetical protein SAMN05444817_11713 [Corynebacterium appendicis CIP 107643]|uniref:Uncharacterized protein n=1 Tax=Corynebacterium appendicis CIP 107643 TaxID=1161099 RepID=A0A1N7KCK8_9CORY|nr:hypothetical protein CAPP_04585 [Corynebacterium appendicis CIP 107643]SIS59174.1 hypothetical protein SAMN05444817_11713 [Corynebacterium appendicis CIP 107643]
MCKGEKVLIRPQGFWARFIATLDVGVQLQVKSFTRTSLAAKLTFGNHWSILVRIFLSRNAPESPVNLGYWAFEKW